MESKNNLEKLNKTETLEIVDRVKQMKTIQEEGLALFSKKNQDYGDAFANYGTIGVLVRMGDKLCTCQIGFFTLMMFIFSMTDYFKTIRACK